MNYVADIKDALHGSIGPDLESMQGNMSRLAPTADRLADIPGDLFDGIDVERLNCWYMPSEFGGEDLLQDAVARCVLSEMIGYADPALTIALPGPGLILAPLLYFGSQDQITEYLGRFQTQKPTWAGFAITEPRGGSDATHLTTTAARIGDCYALNGEKCLIGNGGRAAFFIVYVSTDPARGQFGIKPFLVDAETPGLIIDDGAPMLGLRAVRVARIQFHDCVIPQEQCLGYGQERPGAGALMSAQRSWEYMRPALSSLIIGAVNRLIDDVEGIAEDGDAAYRVAATALADRVRPELGSLRLLSHHAARLLAAGEESALMSSMAKAAAATLACNTASDALLAVTAAGMGEEDIGRDLERWARDFRAFEVLEGTREVHQLMVVRGWRVNARRRRRKEDALVKT